MVLNPKETISKALAELRAEGGPDLTIPRLAQEAQVSAEWLYQLERGDMDTMRLADLERLCRILGRTPNDMLGYEPDEGPAA